MSDSPRILRRKTGNFLEDFRPGQIFRHHGGKTITDGLFAIFSDFSMATNPLSKNDRYAKAYGYRGMVCPPALTMLVAFSQTVEDISENARANLEYLDMRFGAPVYVGDTLEVDTKILGVRTSSSRPNLGIVTVQSTAHKNIGAVDEAIVMTWQRKVQVYKNDESIEVESFEIAPDVIACDLWLPEYGDKSSYAALSHLSSQQSYFEDFEVGTRIEHSRARTVTDEHIWLTGILDNTSQVHCNQQMIDTNPEQYVGGKLIIFGGIPFTLCLGLSSPDIGDNSLGDLVYTTGTHTAPLFAGDTVYSATDVLGTADHPTRADLGIVDTRLLGFKFEPEAGANHDDAPEGWKKTKIFSLDRKVVVKRRSHYA